jgi:hypothetical protein
MLILLLCAKKRYARWPAPPLGGTDEIWALSVLAATAAFFSSPLSTNPSLE